METDVASSKQARAWWLGSARTSNDNPKPSGATTRSGLGSMLAALGLTTATLTASAIGRVSSRPGLWYGSLRKPALTPPKQAFAPVWIALYAAMTYSAWRVWRRPSSSERRRALAWWAAQLGLNASWSPVFFGARKPKAALAILTALVPAIGSYLRSSWRVDRLAGAVVVPYLLWTGFATYLNADLIRKNSFRL